jgi:hypothetical protein
MIAIVVVFWRSMGDEMNDAEDDGLDDDDDENEDANRVIKSSVVDNGRQWLSLLMLPIPIVSA